MADTAGIYPAAQNPAYRSVFLSHYHMKRIRCPKCKQYNTFDETRYSKGQSLVFECTSCRKQFRIRIGTSKLSSVDKDEADKQDAEDLGFGLIEVVENVFAYRQSFALKEGDNIIGRQNPGDNITIPIETTDRSMDRRHCVITVTRDPSTGKNSYSLRDYPSLTGTFLFNRILGNREQVIIEDGAIITLGATTLIFTAD